MVGKLQVYSMHLKWVALNYHPLILSKTNPLPAPSIDLSTPSPQVVQNNLRVNFINDHGDDSKYGSEYGSENDPTDFTRNPLNILIAVENDDI